jgi:hypothetical protein
MNTDIKPNSHKYREQQKETEERKVEKVITGVAKTKKKSEVRKFADIFVSEDMSSIKDYFIFDVLIPGIKDILFDALTGSVKRAFWGERGGSSSKKRSTVDRVSYGRYYDSPRDRRDRSEPRTRNRFDYDDILFDNYADADAVLTALEDVIDRFGVAKVGDLYDFAEVSTNNYQINKYGWTDLHNAKITRGRDGYTINLPRAEPI